MTQTNDQRQPIGEPVHTTDYAEIMKLVEQGLLEGKPGTYDGFIGSKSVRSRLTPECLIELAEHLSKGE